MPLSEEVSICISFSDNGASLDRAAASADSGNTAQMVAMLKKVMQTPEGAALLDRLSSQLQR